MYETEQKEEMLRELLAQEQINMHTLTLSQFSLEWKDFYPLGSLRFWNYLPNGSSEAQD